MLMIFFFPTVCTGRWLSAMRVTPGSNKVLTQKVNVWDYSFTLPHICSVENHSLMENRIKKKKNKRSQQ